MKRMMLFQLCLLYMFACVAQAIEAQDYHPFVVEGKKWDVFYPDIFDQHDGKTLSYVIKGDTIVGNGKGKKLYCYAPKESYLAGCLMEKDKKVFLFERDGYKRLLYDFNMTVGDSLVHSNFFYVYVTNIDSISTKAGILKRMHIHVEYKGEKPPYRDLYWVEGIGGPEGPTLAYGMPVGQRMQNCYENDVCIFSYDDFYAPTWSRTEAGIPMPQSVAPALQPLYDLQGRRASGQPRRGVYIQDGRKRVVR